MHGYDQRPERALWWASWVVHCAVQIRLPSSQLDQHMVFKAELCLTHSPLAPSPSRSFRLEASWIWISNLASKTALKATQIVRQSKRERDGERERESQSSKDDERTDLLKQKLTTRICTCAFSSWMCARARVGSNHSCLSDIWTAVSMSPHSTRIHSRHVQ